VAVNNCVPPDATVVVVGERETAGVPDDELNVITAVAVCAEFATAAAVMVTDVTPGGTVAGAV
jgi:hypothetical protein